MNGIAKVLASSLVLASVFTSHITTANAQSTEYIIFDVSGSASGLTEKFVLGSVLKDGDRIELPENSEVRLLDKTGKVVILTGPVVGIISDEDGGSQKAKDGSNALQIIARLMFGEDNLVNNIGAARTIGSRSHDLKNNQPWLPIISKPGTYCLPMDAPVIGRLDATTKIKITLISGSKIFQEKTWDAEQKTVSVTELVDKDIDNYTLFISSQSSESSIHLLNRTDMNITQQIAWMAERKCRTQAVELLRQASETAEKL
jgi:hypothetical protein